MTWFDARHDSPSIHIDDVIVVAYLMGAKDALQDEVDRIRKESASVENIAGK